MKKQILVRSANGFCYALAINVIISLVFMLVSGYAPLVPDYANKFESETFALLVQLVLIAFMSLVMSAGTVILEYLKIGIIVQSIIFFMVTFPAWLFVGCFCFRLHQYTGALISVSLSYIGTYIICWIIQYNACKRQIKEINERLASMREEE